MHEVTDINMKHTEDLTVTHYNVGGFYRRHHDYILEESMPKSWKNCGPRTFTFLVYLNDVEEGGETWFPKLGVKISPKPGKAALWHNLNEEQTAFHPMSEHAGTPVIKGEKWAINVWIRQGAADSM